MTQSLGFRLGSFVGGAAARTVHVSGVVIESTGQFGKDFVAGTGAGYTTTRHDLAAARAAKYAAIAAATAPAVIVPAVEASPVRRRAGVAAAV